MLATGRAVLLVVASSFLLAGCIIADPHRHYPHYHDGYAPRPAFAPQVHGGPPPGPLPGYPAPYPPPRY